VSSTNRGAVRERDDFYETPVWVTELVLPKLGAIAGKTVLDPFAGRGAILDVCTRAGAKRTIAIEIDSARSKACCKPARSVHLGDTFGLGGARFDEPLDLIITNPPFSRTLEAVEWCLARADGRPVTVLLRLAFLESLERAPFHRKHPADVHVLARRPSFLTKEQKMRIHEEALDRWRVELAAWQVARTGEEPKRPTPPGTDSCAYAWLVWGFGGGRWSVL
jgi:predicted RNA methylase